MCRKDFSRTEKVRVSAPLRTAPSPPAPQPRSPADLQTPVLLSAEVHCSLCCVHATGGKTQNLMSVCRGPDMTRASRETGTSSSLD